MAKKKRKVRRKKRVKKNIERGQAHIHSTFNNTIVTLTDMQGNTIAWGSAGTCGFKGSRMSTAFAGQAAAKQAVEKAQYHGLKTVDVYIKGPGAGREAALRSLKSAGINVKKIEDVTPKAHNGCRPPKKRRP